MCRIILTENNVVDIFRRLTNKEEVSLEEMELVKKRFRQLAGME